jgi:hypothetical protein
MLMTIPIIVRDKPQPPVWIRYAAIVSFMLVIALFAWNSTFLANAIHAIFGSPPTPTITITPTQFSCPYQRSTDHETIVNLIMAEAEAVKKEDLNIINTIFASNADFYDYASEPPAHWNGTYARYAVDLFPKTDFSELEHFEILPAGSGIVGDTAYYTSGSRGSYRIGTGSLRDLNNGSLNSTRYGSDHWILKKNSDGCWEIVEMRFNAGDERFP